MKQLLKAMTFVGGAALLFKAGEKYGEVKGTIKTVCTPAYYEITKALSELAAKRTSAKEEVTETEAKTGGGVTASSLFI